MKCPNCGLINPDSALRCDCGYDFEDKKIKQKYISDKGKRKGFLNYKITNLQTAEQAIKHAWIGGLILILYLLILIILNILDIKFVLNLEFSVSGHLKIHHLWAVESAPPIIVNLPV
jgi:hypothetical protein